MSRVAPPVVIREELAHRSPGHLTGYHLPKEKRSGIEKNGRDERKVRSGRPEPELPISRARLGIRLRHSGKEAREPRSYGATKRARISLVPAISFTFCIKNEATILRYLFPPETLELKLFSKLNGSWLGGGIYYKTKLRIPSDRTQRNKLIKKK